MILDKFDAFIFDLDGTLVDSMWMWKNIDIEYLARFNIPYEENLQSKIEGMSFTETAIYFKEYFKIEDSIEKIKEDWNEMAYDKYSNDVSLKNGVYVFLEYLKGLNKKMGIATSNSKELTLACINSLKISDFFDCIVTGTDIKKGKPAPDIYLENARLLNVSPDKCLVFEDIPVGLLAGRNAGMSTCSVYDEYSKNVLEKKLELSDYNVIDYIDFKNKYLG